MESGARSDALKRFSAPPVGKSGLYIYRAGGPGTALKKDIWLDGECIGQSAPNVYFYKLVDGNKEYTVSTESEFSPNHLRIRAKAGQNHFVKQYIKMGLFVGGANLKLVDQTKGKSAVSKLSLALSGECSKDSIDIK